MKRVIVGLTLLCSPAVLSGQSSPPPSDRSAAARLLGSPDIARPADYPQAALRSRQQGRVWIELKIDESGRVSDCDVQQSSGHDLLDRLTCTLYQRRARYSPALDQDGKVVSARDQRSVDWLVGPRGAQAVDYDSPNLPNRAPLMRSDDYPASAIRGKEQGTVTALVRVDAIGKVTSCSIEQSSGSAALDTRTCEIIVDRGRFEPSRDETGRAVAGEYRQRVTWRLEDGPLRLRNATSESHFRFDRAGKVVSCQLFARVEGTTTEPLACPPGVPREAPASLVERVADGRATIVSEQRIIVDERTAEPLPPLKRNERLLGQSRLRVQLDAEGKIIACISLEASSGSDPCRRQPRALAPVMIEGKPVAASVVISHRDVLRFARAEDAGPTLLNGGELLKADDYPGAAILNRSQGRTVVRLAVDERGKVTDCKIERSSGSDVLDKRSCLLVSIRARFAPALDNSGKAVKSEYRQSIAWRMPGVRPRLVKSPR